MQTQSQPQVKAVSGLWWNISVSQHWKSWIFPVWCQCCSPEKGYQGLQRKKHKIESDYYGNTLTEMVFSSCSFRVQIYLVLRILILSRTHRVFTYFEMFANQTGYFHCPEKHPVFFWVILNSWPDCYIKVPRIIQHKFGNLLWDQIL